MRTAGRWRSLVSPQPPHDLKLSTALRRCQTLTAFCVQWAAALLYSHRVQGLVGYPSSDADYGDGYSLALALTVAGQRHLLPVDAATLASNPCIEAQYSMQYDLRTVPAVQAGREQLTISSGSGSNHVGAGFASWISLWFVCAVRSVRLVMGVPNSTAVCLQEHSVQPVALPREAARPRPAAQCHSRDYRLCCTAKGGETLRQDTRTWLLAATIDNQILKSNGMRSLCSITRRT